MKLDVMAEFSGLDLGHEERTERGLRVIGALSHCVGKSLSQAMTDGGQLTLAYRWLRNPLVKSADLLEPHATQTRKRALASRLPLVAIHDGTEMSFGGSVRRQGLGYTNNNGQGFMAHLTLLAAMGKQCVEPLGVPVATTIFRDEAGPTKKRTQREQQLNPGRLSLVWMENVVGVEELLDGARTVVHVMDRGADSFHRVSALNARKSRFVIRMRHDRKTRGDGEVIYLSQALEKPTPVLLRRTVVLSSRGIAELDTSPSAIKSAKSKRSFGAKQAAPARSEREAELHVVAQQVTLLRPRDDHASAGELVLNVVRVYEPAPPRGAAPVEWLLLTSEPIDTEEDVASVVDMYRARWLIEELNKALKTGGCEYESLQLENRESFLNMLALDIPIAWTLLRLRALSRSTPDAPATEVFSQDELNVLAALRKKPFNKKPTIGEATLALAAFGGHLKRNGPPGYIILGRALRELRGAVDGYVAMRDLLTQAVPS